ncbi:interferon a3-like [Lampetra planeri]
MTHKYSEYSEASFILLDSMAKNSTNITEDAEAVPFPEDLYTQVSKASAEHRMSFIAQILEEVALLFEKDHSSASWDEKTLEDFLGVIHQQAENLRACVGSNHKSKKLQMFFKGLSKRVLERMGHSADAWS